MVETAVDDSEFARRLADADEAVLRLSVVANSRYGWRHPATQRIKTARDMLTLVKADRGRRLAEGGEP